MAADSSWGPALIARRVTCGSKTKSLLILVFIALFFELMVEFGEVLPKNSTRGPTQMTPGSSWATTETEPVSYCGTKAAVAFCMIGTRFDFRERFGIHRNTREFVYPALGGKENIEIFISTGAESNAPGASHEQPGFQPIFEDFPRAERLLFYESFSRDDRVECDQATQDTVRMGGWSIQGRMRDCVKNIYSYETKCGHKFDWVYHDRPDMIYTGDLLFGKKLKDLDPEKYHTYCTKPHYGVCNGNGLMTRQMANRIYGSDRAGIMTGCIKKKYIEENCNVTIIRDQGFHVHSECLMGLSLVFGAKLDIVDGVEGSVRPNLIVRDCKDKGNCPHANFPWEKCGQDLPHSKESCPA